MKDDAKFRFSTVREAVSTESLHFLVTSKSKVCTQRKKSFPLVKIMRLCLTPSERLCYS